MNVIGARLFYSRLDRGLLRALAGLPGRPNIPENSRREADGVDRTARNVVSSASRIACGTGGAS